MDAAEGNRLGAVTLMADLGFDLDRGTGGSPLHMAAWHGHLAMATLLVRCGAKASVTDAEGRTPLDWAEWGGRAEVAEFLRGAGRDG